jgi:excisionase family DNA binding protein
MKITNDDLLTPAEVSRIFSVDPRTVTRWANEGKLTCIRTLGNHRRFRAAEVYRLRDASRQERTES